MTATLPATSARTDAAPASAPGFAPGLHHVTGITRRVQANVDFYMGFLGLHLVKQTGGFEDAEQLHLFYGDAEARPGSIVTFLVWEDGAPGRVGHGQVGEIGFAVPARQIGEWLTRALDRRVPVEGPLREFGETVLRLKDPDGIIVKLIGQPEPAEEPAQDPDTVQGGLNPAPELVAPHLIGVTLFSEDQSASAAFAQRFGFRPGPREGAVLRLLSPNGFLDIRDAAGFFEGIPGTGTFDHVALRLPDAAAVRQARLDLGPTEATQVHDRKYFLSLYVRDPAQVLIELATEGPGFSIDEAPDALGRTLFVPPGEAARAQDLRLLMPQFARPGEDRMPLRDLPFVHRFWHPEDPDGTVLLTLHGSGGSEADLLPLAHRLNPRATLLGLRGRATEEGIARWFRRIPPMGFDQQDIRDEAEAFAAFLDGARRGYGLDLDRLTVLGLSNGANFAGAVMALSPGLLRRAILLRPQAVLDTLPPVDLRGTQVLTLTGGHDLFAPAAPKLNDWLAASGATLDARVLDRVTHDLTTEDEVIARDWLAARAQD